VAYHPSLPQKGISPEICQRPAALAFMAV